MSWLRAAVNHAMNNAKEGGERSKQLRSVRDVANTVVKQALATQDRPHQRNLKSFRHTVKGLEELSVSCRGLERVLLLRRWLVALKEVERITKGVEDNNSNDHNSGSNNDSDEELLHDESIDPPRKPTLIYYYDAGVADEPMNFRDVFLISKALEGLTLSMILEAPKEEEIVMLLEIFRLCLTGSREVHRVVLNKIRDLAKAFSSYQDEVLVKREELLRYAQSAISGLKINADSERVDFEACSMKETLDKMMSVALPLNEGPTKSLEGTSVSTLEDLRESQMQIRLLFELKDLLLKKKSLSNGDSPQLHAEKVDKLKILSESLVSSTAKAETRILDHRSERDDAVKFRKAKVEEVVLIEKDLVVEILELEKQRTELEERLKEVNTMLANACARLNNAREEREQYEDANSQIFIQLKRKEDELRRSAGHCRAETEAVNACIQFLEDTWILQSSYTQQKEKEANHDLEKYGDYFVKLVIHLLSNYKEELGHSIARFREVVENLRSIHRALVAQTIHNESSDKITENINASSISLEELEDEYLQAETQFKTTFAVVDAMKKKFYSQNQDMFRKDDQKVEELFQALQNIKDEFESIERPPTPTLSSPSPTSDPLSRTPKSPSRLSGQTTETHTPNSEQADTAKSSTNQSDITLLGAKAELEKSEPEPRSKDIIKEMESSSTQPKSIEGMENVSLQSPFKISGAAAEVPEPEEEPGPAYSLLTSGSIMALDEGAKLSSTDSWVGEVGGKLSLTEDITKASSAESEKVLELEPRKVSEESSTR